MTTLSDLKSTLTAAFPTDAVAITINKRAFILSAADLAAGLGVTPGASYDNTIQVRVTTTPYLRIRTAPAVLAAETGRLETDTVISVDKGVRVGDNFTWGKVSDGRGWIALDFTTWADRGKPLPAEPPVVPATPPATTPPYTFPVTPFMRGVHGSAGGWQPNQKQFDIMRRNQIKCVLIPSYERGQAASAIPTYRAAGVEQFIIRAAHHGTTGDANGFINSTLPALSEYAAALMPKRDMLIAVHNEPNLTDEGLGRGWNTGAEFSNWFMQVAAAYRARFPGCKIGFPALSPGSEIRDGVGKLIRFDETRFIAGCAPAIQSSDWIGVHYYWTKPDGSDITNGLPLAQWGAWLNSKPIIATEVGPINSVTITTKAVRRAYEVFGKAGIPMMAWVLDGAGSWKNADITLNLGGDTI